MTLYNYYGPAFSNLETIHLKYDGITYNCSINGFERNPFNFRPFKGNPWELHRYNITITGLSPALGFNDEFTEDEFERKCVREFGINPISLFLCIYSSTGLNSLEESDGKHLLLDFDADSVRVK